MSKNSLLKSLKLPNDLKKLSYDEIDTLCKEIREKIIKTVSQNGGHLASSLGVVELTVAINRVFDRPKDKLVWDVGHQCYTDKILTGRLDKIDTIRKEGGLSGFPKIDESIYDCFNVGHSSTSISVATGLAVSKEINGEDGSVIAVIGDGSLSGGLAYEGLNNAGRLKRNLIVILNDNKMSISENVGSMARYLAQIRTQQYYLNTKNILDKIVEHIPFAGKHMDRSWKKFKSLLKNGMYNSNMFENMGFTYYGPIDGHDIKELCRSLELAKSFNKPILLHIVTKKGKGYSFAEENPNYFHGVSSFDIKTGKGKASGENFSSVFGSSLCDLAKNDKTICAITAAMTDGTGLSDFAQKYKNRFFDVGIAEEHAITFAGAVSLNGLKPVFAVYSTFLQRAYDHLIHDVAIQNAKVILAIDRAGIVGEDGQTHQGLFDVSMLNSIPKCVVYSPSYFCEVKPCLEQCLYKETTLCAVRYPRGKECYKPEYYKLTDKPFNSYFFGNIAVVTYGRIFSNVSLARQELLKHGICAKIVKLNRIKPIDENAVKTVLMCDKVIFFEEAVLNGGIAQTFGTMLFKNKFKGEYKAVGIDDKFINHATVQGSLCKVGLDAKSIENTIIKFVKNYIYTPKINFNGDDKLAK